MNWYIVDRKYINYLIRFDSHVGYVEYGKRLKLHVGILLTIGDLLQKEKALIDNVQDILQRKAIKLYQKCIDKPNSSLAARCCDFKMLEEKCSLYSCT